MLRLSEVNSAEHAAVVATELDGIEGGASEVIERAARELGSAAVLAVSLGLEDVVLLDLLSKVREKTGARVRVVTLDTGRLHEQTYALLDRLESRYRLGIEAFFPDTLAVESLLRKQGPNGFYTSLEARHACCEARKLEPMRRALAGATAWLTGIRSDQGTASRSAARVAEWDGRLKLNPLVGWSLERVWAHVREFDVPYNPLHDQGYPSIGCAPCTRAVGPEEDPRAGRWWWERANSEREPKECGLHTPRTAALRAKAARGS